MEPQMHADGRGSRQRKEGLSPTWTVPSSAVHRAPGEGWPPGEPVSGGGRMNRRSLKGALPMVLLTCCVSSPARALEFAEKLEPRSWGTRIRRPAGAEIEYVPQKHTFFLGEPICVLFRVKNNGDSPISFRHGSDYRGAARPLRFMFRAVDSRRRPVPDPHPGENYMGGRGGFRTLKSGEVYERKLLLQLWCEVEKPGRYTVTAGQDIGWDAPVEALSTRGWARSEGGRFSVTLVPPSEADCRGVLDAIVRLIRDDEEDWFVKKAFPYIRHPVYLEPLRSLAAAGDFEAREAAIDGIGSILTPEATLALIELLEHDDPATARLAAQTVNWRLPDPDPHGSRPARNWSRCEHNSEKHLEAIRLSWRDEFARLVLPHARRMLRSENKDDIFSASSR